MTTAASAARTLTEGAVPPPPPEVVPESLTIEPVPFARQLWDLVTLHGSMSESDLRQTARFPLGETIREYARWYPGITPTPTQADDDYFARALQQGLDRGWLVRNRGKITAGICPPEHQPMHSLSREADGRILRAMLHGQDEARARALLLNYKSAARHHVAPRRADLRRSLKTIGQIYAIVRWPQGFGEDPVIIDGVTRYELLKDLGVAEEDMKFQDLGQMTALEALQVRMELELNSTSKDMQDEARNAYIEALSKEGFTQPAIAKLIGVSQSTVSRILSPVSTAAYRGQPEEADVDEFRRLHAGGWNLRAIAEWTGFSKNTVHRYLNGERETKVKEKKATKGGKPRTPSNKQSPEAQKAAEKRGVVPPNYPAPGMAATLESNPVKLKAVVLDPDVGMKIVDEIVQHDDYVVQIIRKRQDFVIQYLVEQGLVTI